MTWTATRPRSSPGGTSWWRTCTCAPQCSTLRPVVHVTQSLGYCVGGFRWAFFPVLLIEEPRANGQKNSFPRSALVIPSHPLSHPLLPPGHACTLHARHSICTITREPGRMESFHTCMALRSCFCRLPSEFLQYCNMSSSTFVRFSLLWQWCVRRRRRKASTSLIIVRVRTQILALGEAKGMAVSTTCHHPNNNV